MNPQAYTSLAIVKQLIEAEHYEALHVLMHEFATYNTDGQFHYIIAAIENGRYRDAQLLIEDFERQNRAVAQVYDPVISALRVELLLSEEEFVQINADCLELGKLLHNFQVHFHNALDVLIERRLHVNKEKMRIMALQNPMFEKQFQAALKELEEFLKEREGGPLGILYGLDEEQARELKALFRKGALICHPDIVDEDQQERAREMFEEMYQAYQNNDIRKLRIIVELLEKTGSFHVNTGYLNSAEILRSKISLVLLHIEEKKQEIDEIKASGAYQTIQSIEGEWNNYFDQIAQNLTAQISDIEHWIRQQTTQN